MPDLEYRRTWFPIAQAGSYQVIAVDLTDPLADASPVLSTDLPADGPWSTPVLPSVAALVEAWTTAVTTGYWRYSQQAGEWEFGPLDLLPERMRLMVV